MYSKIKLSTLMKDGVPVWNPVLAQYIEDQLHGGTYIYTKENVQALPPAVRSLFYVWRAQCEIGGNGFMDLLYQGEAYQIKGIYESFCDLQLEKLKSLMGLALGMSLEEGAPEYLMQEQEQYIMDFFYSFSLTGGTPYFDIEELDEKENTYKLIVSVETAEKINSFILAHLDIISE